MRKRINVMIDDDTWQLLERVPVGERSRAINEALRNWAKQHRRREAAAEMDALSERLPPATTAEIISWIREDRERGH